MSASLECGGQAPRCYGLPLIEYQSGAWPPLSKEAPTSLQKSLQVALLSGIHAAHQNEPVLI